MSLFSQPGPSTFVFGRCFFIFLVYLSCAAQAQVVVNSKLSAEFSVSPSGAATYRIPIDVPPGVAGMEPKLALTYNSQTGNGLMGVGWSIEGLSLITRCARTMATDGSRTAVNYNTDDRFCLDGQRLINVAGAYGAAGSEYRTEIESFSKITSHGAAGGNAVNGPESFVVKTKSGLTMEYGTSTGPDSSNNSRVEKQGSPTVVRMWALSKIVDIKGNFIEFSYHENNSNGLHRISSISYGGRSIIFTYEDRPDKLLGYQQGGMISQTERLSEITTRVGAHPVLNTKITYSSASSIYGSYVSEVQTCAPNLGCTAPLNVEYRPIALNQQMHADGVRTGWGYSLSDTRTYNAPQHIVLDYNGDGISDVVTGLVVAPPHMAVCNEDCVLHPVPILYQAHRGTGEGSYISSTPDTSFGFNANNDVGVPGFRTHFFSFAGGNINGDQYSDLIGYEIGHAGIKTAVAVSNGSGFVYQPIQTHATTGYGSGWNMMTLDLRSSGRSDLLAFYVGSSGVHTQPLLSNGSNGFAMQALQSHSSANYAGWQITATDFNYDGYTDLLLYSIGANGIRLQALLGNGNGSFTATPQITPSLQNYSGYSLKLFDANGDGLTDLVATHQSGSTIGWRTLIAKGDGGFIETTGATVDVGALPAHSSGWRSLVMDVNADGRLDLLMFAGSLESDRRYVQYRLRPLLSDGAGGFVLRDLQTLSGFSHSIGEETAYGMATSSLQAQVIENPSNGASHLLLTHHANYCEGLVDTCVQTDVARARTLFNQDGRKLVTRFTNGGIATDVVHETLTKAGLHTSDATPAYPLTNLVMPMHVVASVATSNGAGGSNTTTYTYGGLKADQASASHPGSGRGTLGFRWMKSHEASTGIETTTEYSQAWPSIGQVTKNETRRAGAGSGGLLKQVTSTYGCYQTHSVVGGPAPSGPVASCGSWASGKVYFPFLATSVEDGWDLNGAVLPRSSTTNTYGGYAQQGGSNAQFGDPTQVQVDVLHGGALKTRKISVNEYFPARTSGANWQLGRLRKATVTSSQY